jgi:hypothetical protein
VTAAPTGTPDNTNKVLKGVYKEYTDIKSVAGDFGTSTMEYKAAARMFGQQPCPQKVAIYSVVRAVAAAPAELSAALASIVELHNEWYLLVDTSLESVAGDTAEIAEFAMANNKLYVATNKEGDVVTTSGVQDVTAIIARAALINSPRVGFIAHTEPETALPHAAWVGRMAATEPGAATWKFKTLAGVSDAGFTTTAITALHEGNVNTYVRKLGVLQTSEGKDTSGTYLDVQRSIDWLQARIEENIMFVLLNNSGKIPYDDTGIAIITNTLQGVLKQAVSAGVIAKDEAGNGIFTVTAPKRADIPANDMPTVICRM